MKTARYLVTGWLFLCFLVCLPETLATSSARTVRQDTKRPSLYWIHKDTGHKIFGIEDIVAFDWDKQMFQLKEDAAMNMRIYPFGLIDLFEVRADNQLLYEGALVSLLCSATYSGPSIWDYNRGNGSLLYQIQAGYPAGKAGQDRRYCEPLKQILDQAGLLKSIDPNNPPSLIHCKDYGWLGEKDGLQVWLDIFTDTFVAKMPARFHFRLNTARLYPDGDYVIETQTTLTANDGRYTRTFRRVFPVSPKYLQTKHPVGLVLSAAVKDGKWEQIEAGPAQLVMEFNIRRVQDKKQGTYSEPIETLKTKPIAINILAPKYNPLTPEAESVMDDFRKAMREQNWQKVLTSCSDTLQQKAKTQPLEEFFETYTPLEKLRSNEEYYVCGQSYIGGESPSTTRQYTGFTCFMTLSKPEQRPCLNWEWKLKKDEKSNIWTIDFPLISVAKQMESEKNRLLAEQQRAEEIEQQRQKGLKTTLVPILHEYVIGKPMLFRLEAVNVSNSVVTIPYFSNAYMVNNPLSVTGPDGNEVLYVGGDSQTGGIHKDFMPGQTEILSREYDVSTQYKIILPGEYSFQYRGDFCFPASQEVKLILKPGKISPKDEITAKILSIKPDDWRLSYAGCISRGSAGTSTHLNLLIAMDAFTLKGQLSVSLHICIDPEEDILANFAFWGPEKIGQSEWGPIYITETKADLFWPDYRESIFRALNLQ